LIAIGRELNDKKARTLFYEMEGFLKTVEKNRDYLSGELWRYFDDTASTMNKKFEELATKVKESQQKGVDLSGELERLIKADKEKERQALDKEHKTIETEQQKLERERHELEQQKAAVEAAKNKTWWMPWVDEAKKLWRSWSQMVLDGTSWILHRFGIK
jgi:chromosome segregation ATPase